VKEIARRVASSYDSRLPQEELARDRVTRENAASTQRRIRSSLWSSEQAMVGRAHGCGAEFDDLLGG
jgi:hypothetical protein